jgi:phosphoglucosamine mutase
MTVMSNQAMRAWCEREKITFVETPVGDRAVLRTLRDRGLILGGEQSGHVIRLDLATTGDGLLTALSLLDVVRRTGKRLADLVAFRPFPQVLINVRTQRRDELTSARELWDVVADAERDLGSAGRVLIRPSGTEPLVRVMVEAETVERARSVGEAIAAVVERTLNGRA